MPIYLPEEKRSEDLSKLIKLIRNHTRSGSRLYSKLLCIE